MDEYQSQFFYDKILIIQNFQNYLPRDKVFVTHI